MNGELLRDASCVPQTTVQTDVLLGLVYEDEFECARYTPRCNLKDPCKYNTQARGSVGHPICLS